MRASTLPNDAVFLKELGNFAEPGEGSLQLHVKPGHTVADLQFYLSFCEGTHPRTVRTFFVTAEEIRYFTSELSVLGMARLAAAWGMAAQVGQSAAVDPEDPRDFETPGSK